MTTLNTSIMQLKCPDKPGIIAALSEWVLNCGGNITRFDQFTTDSQDGEYFMRLEFCHACDEQTLLKTIEPITSALQASWSIHSQQKKLNMGILVSQHDHCLYDLLYHNRVGDLPVNIPFIISNHEVCRDLAEFHQIPFHYLPVDNDKSEQELKIIEFAKQADFLILARYMQILSEAFLQTYGNDIINIHHSFLPSFIGANPYRQAYQRGVKIIGATAHYVTKDLDEGPIIAQNVAHISHHDDVDSLKRKGRNLENATLIKAIQAHIDYRVFRHGNKTIVFN